MRALTVPVIFALLTIVAGCETAPVKDTPTDTPTAVVCPPVKAPVECPVCEVMQCPEPRVIEKIVTKPAPPPAATTAGELNLPIVGAVEWVTLEPSSLTLEARIDTGVETTTIKADDIKLIEKDGKRYVLYKLEDPESGELLEQESALRRSIAVKHSDGDSSKRYIVRMWVSLGESRSRVDVSLAEKIDSDLPLLVGRNFLTDVAIVDVSRKHTITK